MIDFKHKKLSHIGYGVSKLSRFYRLLLQSSVQIRIGLILIAVLFGTAFTAHPVKAAPQFPYSWPDYSVVPIFFVPTDWSISGTEVQSEAAALRSVLPEIQQFYANNFGGRTFRLNDLQIVQASGPKENYHIIWNGKNIYTDGVEFNGNMEAAVIEELYSRGYPTPPAQNESGYSALIFVKGAGGYAGSREFSNADGGWGIVGDWAIDSIQGQVAEGAYWWSGKRKQTGAVAHELGHTFDLPHPDAYGYPYSSTIMGNWWDYPTAGLNDWERSHLASTKAAFFPSSITPPMAPSNLAATPLNGTSIRVSWKDNSNNETGFEISNGNTSVKVGANATSYTWGGLTPGKYMCFHARSYNAAGSSAYTPYACTTTITIPAAPSGLGVGAINGTSIRVSWKDNSNNETGFEISNGNTSVKVGANATSYTWGGLTPGKYMCFHARSYNAAGSSAYTPYACTTTITPPAAPSGLTAIPASTTSIRLNWNDNSNNEMGFEIYNGVQWLKVGANSTSYIWGGLTPGKYMCFLIHAYNSAGNSANTPYSCTTTPK